MKPALPLRPSRLQTLLLRSSRAQTLLLCVALAACEPSAGDRASTEASAHATPASAAAAPGSVGAATPTSLGHPANFEAKSVRIARGERLVHEFECARCHTGTGVEAPPLSKQCVGCHQAILAGKYSIVDSATGQRRSASKADLREWQDHVVHLRHVPDLSQLGQTLREDWLARFLLNPEDLRPALPASMPRFPLSPQQAADIAAYLTRDAQPSAAQPSTAQPSAAQPSTAQRAPDQRSGSGQAPGLGVAAPVASIAGPDLLPGGEASVAEIDAGRRLFGSAGCAACHALTGAGTSPPNLPADPRVLSPEALLAPDLRHTRFRFRAVNFERWLAEPQQVRASALMPNHRLGPGDRRKLQAFVWSAELQASQPAPVPTALPLLKREVKFDEVNREVFRKVCWHCHSQPDLARGDGGPGMTGGFGFKGRKLDLSQYAGLLGGYLDDNGERRSLFTPAPSGEPVLLAVLKARQLEEAGQPTSVRGMPLGLPALSPQLIQLIASWIEQGRPH